MYFQSSGSVISLGYIPLSVVPYKFVSLVSSSEYPQCGGGRARRGDLGIPFDPNWLANLSSGQCLRNT